MAVHAGCSYAASISGRERQVSRLLPKMAPQWVLRKMAQPRAEYRYELLASLCEILAASEGDVLDSHRLLVECYGGFATLPGITTSWGGFGCHASGEHQAQVRVSRALPGTDRKA